MTEITEVETSTVASVVFDARGPRTMAFPRYGARSHELWHLQDLVQGEPRIKAPRLRHGSRRLGDSLPYRLGIKGSVISFPKTKTILELTKPD